MKSKIAKYTALGTTLTLSALVGVVLSTGTAVASKPKVAKTKKRSAVSKVVKHKVVKHKAVTPKKVVKPKKVAPKKVSKPNNESAEVKSILSSTTGLKANVLKLGLNAYKWAAQHGDVTKKYLTIVDFTIPSKYKRMWVINLKTDKVVMKTLVANGKGSGLYNGTRFSNRPRSLMSSLGVYVTGTPYYGSDGLSMHVHGLQPGVNSNAYSRLIEFHGAWYVSPTFAREHGRVGRSWGCFALDKAMLPKVVKRIKDGSVVFAYAVNHSSAYAPYAKA